MGKRLTYVDKNKKTLIEPGMFATYVFFYVNPFITTLIGYDLPKRMETYGFDRDEVARELQDCQLDPFVYFDQKEKFVPEYKLREDIDMCKDGDEPWMYYSTRTPQKELDYTPNR